MGAQVTVITGPSRAGKTERLLNRYREALAARRGIPHSTLWIAPTQRAATQLRERLLCPTLPACFSPGIVTFDRFAEAVLQSSSLEIRPISAQIKRQLLRRLLDAAHADGTLRHFKAIAETEGLVELVATFISELKRLEIWPEEFERACQQRGMTAKDRELIRLYTEYQEALTRHQLYDKEGRYWIARQLLREGARRPYDRLELVIVDGFSDFTRTQHEILEILASRVQELIVTLPLEEEPVREDLFGRSLTTLELLKKSHPDLKVEKLPRRDQSNWPALAHIEQHLFKSPHDLQPIDKVEQIEILACSRQMGEVQAIGRRVKQMIVDEGVRPGEIAVVYRSVSEVAPLIREVFGGLGLPVAIEAQQTLDSAPMVKALTSLLRLELDNWPFRQVLALLSNNYFRPQLPQWDEVATPAACERLVRMLQIPSGRDALMEQCERWAHLDEAEPGEQPRQWSEWVQQRIDDAQHAWPLVRWLTQVFDALPRKATQTQWAAAIAQLAQQTGMLLALDEDSEASRTDGIAWDRLQKALAAGDRLAQWLGEEPPELSLDEALKLMLELLRWEALPRGHDEVGRVRVMSTPSARAIEIPYLFVAGLSEKAVPPADREDRLYGEGDYSRFIEQGLPLVDRRMRGQGEMLLFYEILMRPTKRLVLSYPALDEAAQPLAASSYLLEVERACGENKIPREEEADLSPIPKKPAVPLAAVDFRVRAVHELLQGETKLLAGLLQAEPVTGLADNLLAGLQIVHERQTGDSFGAYEGILTSRAAQQMLAMQFGPDYKWSPSRLEQYVKCPFQFFLERVMRLEPVADLALEIDYMKRGQLLHDALSVVHRRLNTRAGRPASPTEDEESAFLKHFGEVLEQLVKSQSHGGDLEAAQREIDRRMLSQWSQLYHQQHQKYDACWDGCDQPLRPTHFEVRFGPGHGHDPGEDPISTDQPFRFDLGDEAIQITGRIDRIDIGEIAGQPVFNVLDYKSGRATSLQISDIEAGTALQLPLYVMAAEQLLLAEKGAVPWRSAYWFIREAGYSNRRALAMHELQGGQLVPSQQWSELQETIRAKVRELVSGIRRAEFPMQSIDDHCTSQCEFSTVCRVNQTRALEKQWPPKSAEA